VGNEVTTQEHCSTQQAKAKYDVVLFQVLRVTRECTVNDVGEVWLVADVDESKERKDLVPGVVTVVNEEVLESLQELHQKEPKHANGELGI